MTLVWPPIDITKTILRLVNRLSGACCAGALDVGYNQRTLTSKNSSRTRHDESGPHSTRLQRRSSLTGFLAFMSGNARILQKSPKGVWELSRNHDRQGAS